MIRSVVVLYYEVKNWTLDLRTLFHFHRTRDDPPACPNASGHLAVVEVVFSQINGPQSHMAVYLCPALIFAC